MNCNIVKKVFAREERDFFCLVVFMKHPCWGENMRIVRHCKKTFLLLGKGLIIILLMMIPFTGLNAVYPQFLDYINTILSQHPLTCTFFRWSVFISLFLAWPVLFRHMGRTRHWSIEKINYWTAQRLRVFIWFFVWELIIGENIFWVVFNYWKHS